MQPSTCYRHADRVTGASCTRCGRPLCPECMIEAPVGHHCPTCVAEAGRAGKVQRVTWDGPGALTRRAPAVTALIALNIAVFVVDQLDHTTVARYAANPFFVATGDYHRLLTAAFLHANVVHLGFNMLGLYLFGPTLESVLGRTRFLALYAISAFGASVCSYYFSGLTTYSVGASGAVFGLFGASFVLMRARGADTSQIVGLIVVNLLIGVTVPGIDNYAHMGGLATGLLLAAVFEVTGAGRRAGAGALGAQVASVAVVVAVLVSLTAVRTSQLRRDPRVRLLDSHFLAPAPGPEPRAAGGGAQGVGVVTGSQDGRARS